MSSTDVSAAPDEPRDRLLARIAFEAVWGRYVGSDAVTWDGNVESNFGYSHGEMEGHVDWWRERVHPDDLALVERVANEAMQGSAMGWSADYRFRRKDGSWAWVASRCAIERDASGRARRRVGVMMDVTALREAESRLRLFTQQMPARATATDRDLRVLWDTGSAFSSSPSAVGKTVSELFAGSPDRERVLDGCRGALAGESSVLDVDDGTSAARLHLGPFCDPAGNVTGVVGVAFDITDRVRAEEALRKTERLLVDAERLGQTGGWEQDLVTGRIINTESNARLFFGDDERSGAPLEEYTRAVHPDDRDRVMRSREQLLVNGGQRDIEFRVVWPDGSVRWIFGRGTLVRDRWGRAVRVYGTNADITERKRAEEELARRAGQLETLSRKLIEAQETERRAIARELHDDFGQVLTALRLNLVRRHGGDPESLALVDGAIARMRDLAQQLRPALLDERGLEASLRWYVEREAKRAGLEVHLALAPLPARPPVTLEAAAFRIAQEALTNVIRHAAAHRVDVELCESDSTLQLVVRDDGQGFDVGAARLRAANGGSQGLINMQERVALLGGELEIDSEPGRGTAVRARLPIGSPCNARARNHA